MINAGFRTGLANVLSISTPIAIRVRVALNASVESVCFIADLVVRTQGVLAPASALSAVLVIRLISSAYIVTSVKFVSALLIFSALGASTNVLVADVVLYLASAI